MGRRRESESGAAALEFAIVLPVLLLLVVGLVEWGRYFVTRETIVHAAREGARGGTLIDATADDACAAATAFLVAIGISAGCDGGGIDVDMEHSVASGGELIPAVEVQVDLEFTTLTGLPLGLPQRVEATAVMPK